MKDIKKLISEISKITSKYQHLAEVSGNNFNVFNVINVTTAEVRLHSRFIAELLNPNGSHGQGATFLKLFANKFEIALDTGVAIVEIEKYIGPLTDTTGGFIDIFISDNKDGVITIENKIYAPDQKNQLLRYYNHNKKNIFYLTLLGSEPYEKSYKYDNENKLDPEKDFQLISYKYDIKQWLIACRKEAVGLPLLREGISHYINLIETLTGQSSNDIMNKEIVDYISENQDNLKQAVLIAENLTDIKIKTQWLFWENLKQKLRENNLDLIEKDNLTWDNIRSYYQDTRNKNKYYGYWVKVFEKDDISIHFGIEIEDEIYFGFTMERNGKGGVAFNEENKEYRNLVLEINNNYRTSLGWLGSRFLSEGLDFRTFNTEAVFELADSKKLDIKTTKIVKKIVADINTLKLKLENTKWH